MTGHQPGRLSDVLYVYAGFIPFIIYFNGRGTRLTTIPLRVIMLAAAFLSSSNNPVEKTGTLLFHILALITLTLSGDRKYCNDYSPAERLILKK
jgi:hypothetical protein